MVDDNDRHLDILNTILSSVGHDVETWLGIGGRLTCATYVVVLDMVMPEVSGLVVAQQMRVSVLNRHTPVIICTANIALARRQLIDVQGIVAIIGKPIDTANLILAVARAPLRDRALGVRTRFACDVNRRFTPGVSTRQGVLRGAALHWKIPVGSRRGLPRSSSWTFFTAARFPISTA